MILEVGKLRARNPSFSLPSLVIESHLLRRICPCYYAKLDLGECCFSLAIQKPPNGEVVRMEFLSEVIPVTWDIDEHKRTHRSLDRAMSFWDNRRCPEVAWERKSGLAPGHGRQSKRVL